MILKKKFPILILLLLIVVLPLAILLMKQRQEIRKKAAANDINVFLNANTIAPTTGTTSGGVIVYVGTPAVDTATAQITYDSTKITIPATSLVCGSGLTRQFIDTSTPGNYTIRCFKQGGFPAGFVAFALFDVQAGATAGDYTIGLGENTQLVYNSTVITGNKVPAVLHIATSAVPVFFSFGSSAVSPGGSNSGIVKLTAGSVPITTAKLVFTYQTGRVTVRDLACDGSFSSTVAPTVSSGRAEIICSYQTGVSSGTFNVARFNIDVASGASAGDTQFNFTTSTGNSILYKADSTEVPATFTSGSFAITSGAAPTPTPTPTAVPNAPANSMTAGTVTYNTTLQKYQVPITMSFNPPPENDMGGEDVQYKMKMLGSTSSTRPDWTAFAGPLASPPGPTCVSSFPTGEGHLYCAGLATEGALPTTLTFIFNEAAPGATKYIWAIFHNDANHTAAGSNYWQYSTTSSWSYPVSVEVIIPGATPTPTAGPTATPGVGPVNRLSVTGPVTLVGGKYQIPIRMYFDPIPKKNFGEEAAHYTIKMLGSPSSDRPNYLAFAAPASPAPDNCSTTFPTGLKLYCSDSDTLTSPHDVTYIFNELTPGTPKYLWGIFHNDGGYTAGSYWSNPASSWSWPVSLGPIGTGALLNMVPAAMTVGTSPVLVEIKLNSGTQKVNSASAVIDLDPKLTVVDSAGNAVTQILNGDTYLTQVPLNSYSANRISYFASKQSTAASAPINGTLAKFYVKTTQTSGTATLTFKLGPTDHDSFVSDENSVNILGTAPTLTVALGQGAGGQSFTFKLKLVAIDSKPTTPTKPSGLDYEHKNAKVTIKSGDTVLLQNQAVRMTVDTSGVYTSDPVSISGLAVGNYKLYVKPDRYFQKRFNNIGFPPPVVLDLTTGGYRFEAGDTNNDGVINAVDVNNVLNAIVKYQNGTATADDFRMVDFDQEGTIMGGDMAVLFETMKIRYDDE